MILKLSGWKSISRRILILLQNSYSLGHRQGWWQRKSLLWMWWCSFIRVGAKSAVKTAKWRQKAPPYRYLRWYINHHISYTGCRCSCQDENYVNADAFIFFREKIRPFPHLAKPISRTFRKDEKSNGTDKKRLVWYRIWKLRKGKNVWQMEREDTSLTGKIIRYRWSCQRKIWIFWKRHLSEQEWQQVPI